MSLHVVLGKGPVGSTLTERLVDAGHDVRVLSRSGGRSTDRVEHVALDASDTAALTAASRGAAVLYNCANPPTTAGPSSGRPSPPHCSTLPRPPAPCSSSWATCTATARSTAR
jgi:uncharacterized protein YbjT (DUF2867 family)